MRIFFLILLFCFSAKAQVFTPTIAGGMGGAGRAAVDGGESSFLNPASTAELNQYFVGGHYQVGNHPREGDYSRYAVSIADGTSGTLFPGAFSYYHQSIDLPANAGSRIDQDFQLSLAGFVLSKVALGVAGHYFMTSGQGRENVQAQANVGVIFSPTDALGFALVGYDLLPTGTDIAADRRRTASYAAGVNYVFSDLLRLRLDLVRPDVQIFTDHRIDVEAGLESFFAKSFVFRLGMQAYETMDETNLTGGFGYRGPRLSLDYSFQKDLRSGSSVRHLVDLWLPL